MATVTGTLRDFGLSTLAAFSPRVIFTPSGPTTTKTTIFTTRPVVAVPNASGSFTVELQETESVQPAVFYRVRIEWLEAGDGGSGYVGMDLLDWDLHVPGDGAIGEFFTTPANPARVWVGLEPPINPTPGTWWLRASDTDPTDPRNTGYLYEWSSQMGWLRKADLRGPKGDKGNTGAPGRGADESSIKLACLGDSMTAMKQGGYPSYAALVSEYLGLALFNPSVAGERTTNIAVRQGGHALQFKVPSGVMPADTTPFPVTLVDSYTSGLNSGNSNFPDIGFFDDMSFLGFPVSITFRDNVWTMAKKTADTVPFTVPAEGGWARSTKASAWRDAIQVFMGGYNGGDQVRDVATMSAYLTRPGKFIFLSMARASSGGDSTPYSTEIARWKAAYPAQFYDMSAYVRDNGLADEGITPTTQDKADIAAGNVPASLRRSASDPHYNAAGQRVIARRLAELLLERGMVDKSSGQHIPSRAPGALPPSGLVLSLPSSSAAASVASSAELQASDSVSVRLMNLALTEISSPAAYRNLVSRWASGAPSWRFLLATDGTLFFQDANGNGGVPSANQLPLKNGKVSVRLDIDRTAGTQRFFTSIDGGISWDAYGTPLTNRSKTNPISGFTTRLVVGNDGTAAPTGTKLDRVTILNASGTVLVDHDFTVADTEGWAYTGGAAIVPANA